MLKGYVKRLSNLINASAYKNDLSVIEDADHSVSHEMNVLGSGWIKNKYGMQTLGFAGNNYSDTSLTYEKVRATMPLQFEERAKKLDVLLEKYAPGFEPIDWQIDLKSGARYDLIPASQIKFGILEGVDAKMTADMNRLYPLVTLGRAWTATGKSEYLREFFGQFIDWMRMNPEGYGAAWRGNMNVSIRIVNILCGFSIISSALDDEKDAELLGFVKETVDDHIKYISANLEFTELPTSLHPNHYIANLTGLLVASSFAGKDNRAAEAWERLALRELGLTFDWQINCDGIDFESTTMYHAFAIEMLVYALILASKSHSCVSIEQTAGWISENFGSKRLALMKKMFIALNDLTACNGFLPVVGDADSGRYVYLEKGQTPDRDRRFLLVVGAALFGNENIPGCEDVDTLTAQAFFEDYKSGECPKIQCQSAGYSVSGFYTMRDKNNDWYSFICCAPIGTGGLGSHSHNDRLEVLLTVKDHDIIIDPGVYAYTASRYWRSIYRDSFVHSTVTLDNIQPNRLSPPDAWWGYHDDTRCKCIKWEVSPETTVFEGESYAYERLEVPVVHNRTVTGKAGALVIVDKFLYHKAGNPKYCAEWNFMLGPTVSVISGKGTSKIELKAGEVTVTMKTENGIFDVSEATYAPVYGAKAETKKLSVSMEQMPLSNKIEITWR